MADGKTKAELEAEIADLEEENQELQGQLDSIADIVAPPDDDGNGDDDESLDTEEYDNEGDDDQD